MNAPDGSTLFAPHAKPGVPITPRAAASAAAATISAHGNAIPLRPPADGIGGVPDPIARPLGAIIQEAHQLGAEQVERILAYQREHGVRFGEAAVKLGLVRDADVLWALSQQFQYPNALRREAPLDPELVTAAQPFSPQAEVFRSLRSQLVLRLNGADAPRRAIAIVSPQHGDGRSYVAANLAIAFSQLGGRTLLLDADLRNPRQHRLFGLGPGTGLSAILSGRESARVIHPVDGLPSLYVLPVGTLPPNPQELAERPAFALLVRDLLAKFDHVIVDTPAACSGADPAVIAARCGAALTVARKGRSHTAAMAALVAMLRAGPATLVGATLSHH